MIYFLDTDICIYYLNGEQSVVDGIRRLSPDRVKIPAIVQAELIEGVLATHHSKRNLGIIEAFCSPFEIVPFCQQCAAHYGHIRHHLRVKGTMIGPNDLIIASTVIAHHGTLITHNTKEFNRVPDIKLHDFLG